MSWHAFNTTRQQTTVGYIGRDGDVGESDTVNTTTRGTIVFLRLKNTQVEESSTSDAFSTNAVEPDVADMIEVTAINSQQTIAIIVEDVAIMDAYMSQGFAVWVAVVTMRTYVDWMRNIWPENATADIDIGRTTPVPPAVIIKGDAVVACAQKTILHPHTTTAHEVDAIAPRTRGEGLDVANRDVAALTTELRRRQ